MRSYPRRPLHCDLRRIGSCVCLTELLILTLDVRAAEGTIAFRLEADYGVLAHSRDFEGRFSNGRQALHWSETRSVGAGAFGMRASGGYVLRDWSTIAVYPRLSVAYVPTQRATVPVRGALNEYAFEVERSAWSIDVGAELQLFRRQWLLDTGIGVATTYSSFRLPGYDALAPPAGTPSPSSEDSSRGLLFHLATGWRAPLDRQVTFGVKAAGEAVYFVGLLVPAGPPTMLRGTFSVFVEWDPPPPYDFRSDPHREEVL